MRLMHKRGYVEIVPKRDEIITIEGTNRPWKEVIDGNFILSCGCNRPGEGVIGMRFSFLGRPRFFVGLLPDNPIRINDGPVFESPYKKAESYLNYRLHGPQRIWKKHKELLMLFYKLAVLVNIRPQPLTIFVQDYANMPHSHLLTSYYMPSRVNAVIIYNKGNLLGPNLAHEITHYLFQLSPEETRRKAIFLWGRLGKDEFKMIEEGRILRNLPKCLGHPWDEAEEMLASAMVTYLFQTHAKNPLSPLMAGKILEEIWGPVFMDLINQEWLVREYGGRS